MAKKKSLDERITEAEAKAKAAAQRARDLKSKRSAENRKVETRANIILGAAIRLAVKDKELMQDQQLQKILHRYVTRERDVKTLVDAGMLEDQSAASDNSISPTGSS